ncbi:unnamed protein product [Closterium sp. Naga37s-1]|nr:unnamed protein product [Closterium sp. Naga37s-1]
MLVQELYQVKDRLAAAKNRNNPGADEKTGVKAKGSEGKGATVTKEKGVLKSVTREQRKCEIKVQLKDAPVKEKPSVLKAASIAADATKETEEPKSCGVNGRCIKDETTGASSCVCDTGYVLQADGKTFMSPPPLLSALFCLSPHLDFACFVSLPLSPSPPLPLSPSPPLPLSLSTPLPLYPPAPPPLSLSPSIPLPLPLPLSSLSLSPPSLSPSLLPHFLLPLTPNVLSISTFHVPTMV